MDSPGQLPWSTSPQKIFTQKTKIPIFFKLKGFSHSFERMDCLANLPVTPKKKQISSQKIYYTFLYYILYNFSNNKKKISYQFEGNSCLAHSKNKFLPKKFLMLTLSHPHPHKKNFFFQNKYIF